jgi:hypothetical protein
MNSVLYCYDIKISDNQHLNSSLSEAEEPHSVHTGILNTATIMTAHMHIHRYLFTGIMTSISTAVTHNTYICNP